MTDKKISEMTAQELIDFVKSNEVQSLIKDIAKNQAKPKTEIVASKAPRTIDRY